MNDNLLTSKGVVGGSAGSSGAPILPLKSVMQLITPGVRARKSKRLLVYVHIPFCSSKCHFCDWVVGYETKDLVAVGDLHSRYVDALCAQILAYGPRLQELQYSVTNIYWGGGTPTRLSSESLARINAALASAFDLSSVVEHTAECSPETLTREHVETLRAAGLNRISIGVQSFDDCVLRRMGRAHSAEVALQAISLLRETGIDNFNIDLIAGFPEQSQHSLLDSVNCAIEQKIPHLSLYMFREFAERLISVKQMRSGHRPQASREERQSHYFAAKSLIEAAGYEEYMVGYFARRRDLRFDAEDYYFSLRGDYFGFGAGAASVVGHCLLKSGSSDRYGSSQISQYIQEPTQMSAGPAEAMPDDIFTDTFFKAFATSEGVHFDRWKDQFGFGFREFRKTRSSIREWFQNEERGGAHFVEGARGIALSPQTWIPTMIWRR